MHLYQNSKLLPPFKLLWFVNLAWYCTIMQLLKKFISILYVNNEDYAQIFYLNSIIDGNMHYQMHHLICTILKKPNRLSLDSTENVLFKKHCLLY